VPKQRKVSTLDGYATLKAVARTAKTQKKPQPAGRPATATSPAPAPQPELQNLGAHVARTVLPAKHVIECYECGYKFQLHGRAAKTNCSKCRTMLDMTDHTIDRECSDSLRTTGTIRLAAGAVLKGGDLVANDVVLEGIVEAGRIRAMRRLEIGEGAIFSEKAVSAVDLKIGAGATLTLKQEARYREIEVHGTLNARLHASGSVTIKAGGLLSGEVHTEHLVVEDGGGLKAVLHIAPGAGASVVPHDPFSRA
jgi:cytoskeletal protein CcmA (bactofilin family)